MSEGSGSRDRRPCPSGSGQSRANAQGQHAGDNGPQKPGTPNLPRIRPARRTVRRHVLSFFCPPDREYDRYRNGSKATARGDAGTLDKDDGRVRIELEPADKKGNRLIDRPLPDHEPGRPELRLEGETPGGPLG